MRYEGSDPNFRLPSYSLTPDQLYYGFPTKKYTKRKLPLKYVNHYRPLYGEMFRYFFYLVIKDIIFNKITFKLPPGTNGYLEMCSVTGDAFMKARLNGAFQDVDYLASNFTGYKLQLRFKTRFGSWKKHIYVNRRFKDEITRRTNLGENW